MLRKLLTFTLGLAVLLLVLMFSLVAFAFIGVAALILAVRFWWKLRQLKQQPAPAPGPEAARSHIIEGEWIRTEDTRVFAELPRDRQ